MSWLLALVEAIKGLFAVIANRQAAAAERAEQEDGAARAEAETMKAIAEGADEQARINSAPRDARSVGERLRADADKGGRPG